MGAAQLSLLDAGAAVAPSPATSGPPAVRLGQRVWARRGYLANKGPLEPATVIEVATASRFVVRFDRDGFRMDHVVLTYGPGRWLDREPTAEECTSVETKRGGK
jgi:hypothetical protein